MSSLRDEDVKQIAEGINALLVEMTTIAKRIEHSDLLTMHLLNELKKAGPNVDATTLETMMNHAKACDQLQTFS
jgi:hypothetical protein